MAKALLGHVAMSPDVRLLEEVGRLRRRVQELEQELSTTRAEQYRRSSSSVEDSDLIRLHEFEHAGI